MKRSASLVAAVLFLGTQAVATSKDKAPPADGKLPDGVYAVQREGAKEKEVLPLKEGEALAVHRHRYLKKADDQPPRFLVIRFAPEGMLDLAGEPKAEREGDEVVRILLKLRPKAATALERLTRDHLGRHVAIVVGGEVVTMHKVREVIKNGDVQITSCAPGAAKYLLEQLKAHQKRE